MPKISIILADDHQIVRQGMRALLDAQSDIEVIGEVSDGYELVVMVEKLQPQVVITDIAMPNLNGMDATRQIRKKYPDVHVIMLSMHPATSYVMESLRSGAQGYLLKNDDFAEVLQAVYAVVRGRRYLSAQISEKVIDVFISDNRSDGSGKEHLTNREREIIQLIAEGNTSSQIAARLNISIRTAEKHRANIKAKFKLNSQADLVHLAIQMGIVEVKE